MSWNYQNKKNPNKKGVINPKEKQQIAGLDANFRMGIEQFLIEFMENEELMKYVRRKNLTKSLLIMCGFLMFLLNTIYYRSFQILCQRKVEFSFISLWKRTGLT